MKVAFVLSGSPDGLKYLDKNREKVASKLKHYNWEVRVATFYNLPLLQSYIDEFKDQYIEDFIFFYTGHGDSSSSDGILTLKLHDGTPVDLNTLHNSYFSQLNLTRKAIILDACYSGNFEGRKFHDKTEYLCSSDFDEESYEDTSEDGLQHSYFSYYFCEALDSLEGLVTLELINQHYLEPNIDVQNSKYISIDSKMVIADKNRMEIENSLPEVAPVEPSAIDQIFLIFKEEDDAHIGYSVEGYIQSENEFDNELIEFNFENIYDEVEQEAFIQKLVDEFESDVTIHFIIPPELFLLNFKQWRYRDNELVKRYHILLHNRDRFDSKIRKYRNMIEKWRVLFEAIKDNRLSDALLVTDDNSTKFDTRLGKIGVCFKQYLSGHDVINSTLDMANVGLWQYQDGTLADYHGWVESDSVCLNELNYQSRECDHMALLWDDMSLLEALKRRI